MGSGTEGRGIMAVLGKRGAAGESTLERLAGEEQQEDAGCMKTEGGAR